MKKKEVLMKKPNKKVKHWIEDPVKRKENKMNTIYFKKTKTFIDRIDPTNSNYNKTVVVKD